MILSDPAKPGMQEEENMMKKERRRMKINRQRTRLFYVEYATITRR
jgi:hypothetical protein